MEQKRTLWILLATGIFLLVVLGFAMLPFASSARTKSDARALRDDGIIWVAPSSSNSSSSNLPEISNQNNESQNEFSKYLNLTENENIADFSNFQSQENPLTSAISSPKEGTTQISENLKSSSQIPYATDNLTVISTGTTNFYDYSSKNSSDSDEITTIDLNNLKKSQGSTVQAQNQTTQKAIQETQSSKLEQEKLAENKIYQNSPASSANYSISSAENSKSLSSSKSNSSSKSSASNTTSKNATKSTNTTKNSSAKTSSSSSVAKSSEKIPDRFWVQAASYTSKKNADEARAILDENKIQCEVFTYTDSKNNLYYRLRVGPYTTKTEAEYWKNRIDSIELFKNNNTYVTNSSAAKK